MDPHAAAWPLEWVSSEYMLRWLRRLPGVTVTRFGEAVWGACSPRRAEVDFVNTVHRLLPDHAGQVPAIAEHYRAAGVRPWFEVMPAPGFDRLAAALHEAGARQTDFLVMLERELPAPPPPASPADGVTISGVGEEDLDDFARVLLLGHGVPEARVGEESVLTREHAGVEGSRLYLARVDGRPAAAAVLFLAGDVAYLANASTVEPFRRLGCQTALIQRRLADATEAGCRRIGVITTWASQSHANLARAGFRPAYTKAVWRLNDPRLLG
jgi:GNAT superfamily N-acetyltransferase